MGATRIVQRVICVGGDGRKSCSARGSNYLRTYEAEVRIADVLAPRASVLGDTPLGRGEWVGGTQPLNYDASDNVGVRTAACDRSVARPAARISGHARSRRPSAPSRIGSRARTGLGSSTSTRSASPRARKRSSSRPMTPPATSEARQR